jgi:hypothetical protein
MIRTRPGTPVFPGGTGLMTCHWHPRACEVPLSGLRMTSGIVRRGDRLMGPWSPAVHEYLQHLEAAGFDGSPRVLETEGDREVLTFIDGDVAVDPRWQPEDGRRLPPYAGPNSPCASRGNCSAAPDLSLKVPIGGSAWGWPGQ